MELYSKTEDYRLYHGNCLDMEKVIAPNSIDSIITDPPYEIDFMGKSWDKSGVAFQKETWEHCYNVLKAGGYMLVFGGSRTFHRIACAIEDAGFEIRDTIMWLYGSGFIHSNDLGKYIESKVLFGNANTQKFKELQGEKSESGNWGVSSASKRYDYRPTDYTADGHLYTTKVDYQTEEGRMWDGWGYALKPSYEPIIVARKPCEGTLVDNILKYGTGGMNLKECKIGNDTIKGGTTPYFKEEGEVTRQVHGISIRSTGCASNVSRIQLDDHEGRFPTNTILTYDDSDFEEVCGGMPVGGKNGSITKPYQKNGNIYGKYNNGNVFDAYDDSGSASRYFYCAKATTWDREEGLEDLPEQLFHRMREDADNNKPTGLNKEGRFAPVIRKNIHPTVKPTALMQYLIRLVTQNGGTVLDPFNGSGSTGKACMVENKERNKGYQYIGIELTEDYLPIAKGRIEWVLSVKTDPFKQIEVGKKPKPVRKDENQLTLWDYFGMEEESVSNG